MSRNQALFFFGILPALFFNVIGSFFYFILFADSGFANILYVITKGIVLVYPFLWLFFIRKLPVFSSPKDIKKSLLWGLLSGITIFLLGFALYFFAQEYFDSFAPLMYEKVVQMSIQNHYILFAFGISIFHSLLEEFYWRFFVFRGLLIKFGVSGAAIVSSIGFSLHHFVVLSQYFPSITTTLLGISVFLGGLLWCGIYAKTNSFLGSWLSHFFVDAGIFSLGYLMMFS